MKVIEIRRDGQQITVQVEGDGPLVLCVPGMGESRASFRHLTPGLVHAGFRVAVMDLRGHGDSSVDFASYDDQATASDVLAIIDALSGEPATVIGNSMGAATGVIAATVRPEAIASLVLIGPFVRDHGTALSRRLQRIALSKPWGPAVWGAFYRSLFGKIREADHDKHVRLALSLLRRPGRWRAFQATARTSHAPAEAALTEVKAESLVIMGEKDPDFRDPEAEASWVSEAIEGSYRMIAAAGHYPMAEQPAATLEALLPFLENVAGDERAGSHE